MKMPLNYQTIVTLQYTGYPLMRMSVQKYKDIPPQCKILKFFFKYQLHIYASVKIIFL